MLSDDQLLRYNRQIMLPAFDIAGQERLRDSRILIVGMGGLGCPAALYLAAAGVGRLHLADLDRVEITNLQRQVAYGEADVGETKVAAAGRAIKRLNREVDLTLTADKLEGKGLESAVRQADLVIDATDNFASRHAINSCCVTAGKPLVSGAAIRMEGQVAVFDHRSKGGGCYRCLYPEQDEVSLTCSESGVMAPLVGVIGSILALEAIKVVSALGEPLTGKLLLLDGMTMSWRTLRLPVDPECPCCAIHHCQIPG